MPENQMPAKVWLRVCGGGVSLPGGRAYQSVAGGSREAAHHAAYVRADIAERMAEALESLTSAKALSGVRGLVAGWNGENRPDGPYKERHPSKLGATLPKTNCGAVYELDEAMERAHSALRRLAAAEPGEQPAPDAPQADQNAERMRAVLQRLYDFATGELKNIGCLASNPPQSAAAWDIRNAISMEFEALTAARGADWEKSDGREQVAFAKCSATGVHPTDTSCAAEPEVAPCPSDRPADVTVEIKPLEWRGPISAFPTTIWEAKTPFGHYLIEEVSASDSPAYEVRFAGSLVSVKDGIEEAKEASQSDYEKRVRSTVSTISVDESVDRVLSELRDRRLLNDVDDDLHQEIAIALIKAVWPLTQLRAPDAPQGVEPRGCPTPGACSCPPQADQNAERMRAVLQRLYDFATGELKNIGCLASNPPQSAAAWDIRNAISMEFEALTAARGADWEKSDGREQVAFAKCSATGVHPTDTSCAAEPEVAPCPSDRPADVTESDGDKRDQFDVLGDPTGHVDTPRPQDPADVTVQDIACTISKSHGEDPEDFAFLTEICGPNNEQLPNWMKYEEQARALLDAYGMWRR